MGIIIGVIGLFAATSGSPAVGIILIVAGVTVALVARLASTPSGSQPREGAAEDNLPQSRPVQSSSTNGAHRSPPPAGAPVHPWAPKATYTPVVGEAYRDPASLRRLFKNRGLTITQDGEEIDDTTAQLAPDPNNPYDPNAVTVWIEGTMVGFLAKELAADYASPLAELAEEGKHLEIKARIWARLGYEGRIHASASVWLPPATGVQSFNALPDEPYWVLPTGRGLIQVTREEDHMEALSGFLCDQERYLAVTLHAVEEARTSRSTPYEGVEVRLMGQRVGVLTKAMSEQLRDLVVHVAGRGRVPVCRATLRGSPLRAELTLHTVRSADVTRAWLDQIPLATGTA